MGEFFKKYFDTLILFGSLGFLVMWVDQVLYSDVSMSDSYFFLMFALAGFLFYTYRRGLRKMGERNGTERNKTVLSKDKKTKKYNYKQTLKTKVNKRKRKS